MIPMWGSIHMRRFLIPVKEWHRKSTLIQDSTIRNCPRNSQIQWYLWLLHSHLQDLSLFHPYLLNFSLLHSCFSSFILGHRFTPCKALVLGLYPTQNMGQGEPTTTSASSRMHGGWIGNTFPLGSSALTNHDGQLSLYFYYPTNNYLALTYVLSTNQPFFLW